jgi:dienelactone hydrolase
VALREQFTWPAVACLVVAAGLAVTGAVGLSRADDGTVARTLVVDGVPILEVSPDVPGTGKPAAVVAHGFAGSATLMRGFADTLAAQGYVVVVPDFAGHGRNPARLPATDPGAVQAPHQRDLDAAVRHARSLPAVDPQRIVLIGHSMGAAAVVAYAADHPEIRATVAISIGSAAALPEDPALPRNLLLIVGSAEFARFHDAAVAALQRAEPTASFGETVGDRAAGTARRAVLVPGVEHISVLYASRTHAETVDWLNEAVAAPSGAPPRPHDRLVPAALLVLAFGLGFVPLVALLLPGRAPPAAAPDRPAGWRYAYGGLAGGLLLAVLAAGLLPTVRLPLAVGGYAAGFFALAGVALIVGYVLDRRSGPLRPPAPQAGRRQVAVAAVLAAYAAAAVAVPLTLGLTHAVPVGARWWLLPIVIGCLAVLLLGAELLAAGTRWRQPLILALTVVALLAATLVGRAPGFVLLVLPLLAVLFAWHAGWSALLRRRSAPRWLPAPVGAVLIGWPITTTLPLTG